MFDASWEIFGDYFGEVAANQWQGYEAYFLIKPFTEHMDFHWP